jgi:DNA uptake protein ComE-like DNA-binding protein
MTHTRIPALLGATVLLATLAACGGGESGQTETAAEAPAAPGAATAPAAPAADTAAAAPMAPAAPAATGAFLDPDGATRDQLLAIPGFDVSLADAVVAGRPYADMRAVDRVLAGRLSEEQRDSVYTRLWKPLDLNGASKEEILLIPGVGNRMQHEFEEYRPYRNIEQFRREIGKYVDEAEVARLERYVTIRQAQ